MINLNPQKDVFYRTHYPKRQKGSFPFQESTKISRQKEIRHHENIIFRSPYQKLIYDTKNALQHYDMSLSLNKTVQLNRDNDELQKTRGDTSLRNRKERYIKRQLQTLSPALSNRKRQNKLRGQHESSDFQQLKAILSFLNDKKAKKINLKKIQKASAYDSIVKKQIKEDLPEVQSTPAHHDILKFSKQTDLLQQKISKEDR